MLSLCYSMPPTRALLQQCRRVDGHLGPLPILHGVAVRHVPVQVLDPLQQPDTVTHNTANEMVLVQVLAGGSNL